MRTPAIAITLLHTLRRLARCERGAVLPLFLVSAAVIFGASLGGIDLARHASVTTRLQNALDGAALAMGKMAAEGLDPSANPQALLLEEARRYFEVNFPDNYHGSKISASNLSLEMNGRVFTLSVEGSLDLLSKGFLEKFAAQLRAKSRVTLEGNPNLEIVYAMDTSAVAGDSHFTASLADMSRDLLDKGQGDIHIGVVPYSEVVNVGKEHSAWVDRWLEHDTRNRAQAAARHYLTGSWAGCIAEPEPWKRPDPSRIHPLDPQAPFFPVLVRVQTTLLEKRKQNQNGWQLENISTGSERVTQYFTQPKSLKAVGTGADRLFWSMYDADPGRNNINNAHDSRFDIFSLHEPQNCLEDAKVRFLMNEPAEVENSLQRVSSIAAPTAGFMPLPPAGLLWSWRMLTPEWRQGDGWNAPELAARTQTPARAIVLVSSGAITPWTELVSPVPQRFSLGSVFHFQMDYHVDTCKGGDHQKNDSDEAECKNGNRYVRTHLQNKPLPANFDDWQRPVSSLAMNNPFREPYEADGKGKPQLSSQALSFQGWWPMGEYLEKTCRAITNDGIRIFVLSTRQGQPEILNLNEFLRCASDTTIYRAHQLETLEQTLLNLRSDSTALRLVPAL